MAIEGQFQVWNVTATEALESSEIGKAVSVNGTLAASTATALGVLRSSNVVGGQLSAVYNGITKVKVGAAVSTAGWPITVTASGFFTVATSGNPHCGRVLAAAASGDLVPAMVDFITKPLWHGV